MTHIYVVSAELREAPGLQHEERIAEDFARELQKLEMPPDFSVVVARRGGPEQCRADASCDSVKVVQYRISRDDPRVQLALEVRSVSARHDLVAGPPQDCPLHATPAHWAACRHMIFDDLAVGLHASDTRRFHLRPR